MTGAYLALVVALTVLAVSRKRDTCTMTLAVALLISITVIEAGAWSYMPFAAAIDAATCVVMLVLWTRHTSMRAWSVGFIGLIKGLATLVQYLVDPYAVSWAYAVLINGGFVAQVLVAGGWADAVGFRVDRLFARIAPVRHRLLRDGS